MTKQDQRVSEGGQAYQAGGDIVVQQGINADQMAEILVKMGTQLALHHQEAIKEVERRLATFRDEILKAFASTQKADPEAFRDPDFLYALGEAQSGYARSGDEAVRDTLVDIISRRSLEKERNRMAVTLNDAATKAPNLTRNEYSALSLCYILRYTKNNGINSLEALVAYLSTNVIPFLVDFSREQSSFWHLEAQSCATVEMGSLPLEQILRSHYGGVLSKGFEREPLYSHLPPEKKTIIDQFIIPCLHDNGKNQINAINKDHFLRLAKTVGLSEGEASNVWNFFEGTMYAGVELQNLLASHIPETRELFSAWDETALQSLKLTSVGIAIGHANAVRVAHFEAPLNIWIK